MRAALPLTLFIASLTAMSMILTSVASTFALGRDQVQHLDADLASLIRADYSADPGGASLAPLDERIIDAVRQDEERLQGEVSDVEIVPVFRVNAPGSITVDDSPWWTTATPEGTRTPSPRATSTPDTTPPSGSTPPPGTTPLPGTTPDPRATPSPGDTPLPRLTPAPTPTATPTSGATPAPTPPPTPAPSPATFTSLYLHNDPSPPFGNTTSHPVLPMDLAAPTSLPVHNYDTDRDTALGLTIKKGGAGPGETDTTKCQVWRTPALATGLKIQGDVVVELWSAMKNLATGSKGAVTVYLRDFDGSSYTEIGQSSRIDSDWQGGSSAWVLKTFVLNVGSYTVPAGHFLELKVIVESSSDDDIWFVYDTWFYNSQIAALP